MKRPQYSARQEKEELIKKLHRLTRFEKKEVAWLLDKFDGMASQCGERNMKVVDRQEFLGFLFKYFDMTDDLMMDRIFRAFNTKNDNRLCKEQFVRGMYIFLKGTLTEQTSFAFSVYDFNSDGYISKEEIFSMCKNCFHNQFNKVMGDEDPEEGTKDMVDIVLKKLDYDNDFRVSRADFEQSIPQDALLLECLGPCFPEGESKRRFMMAMEKNETF